jgi:nicotinamidase-related amidase
MEKLQINKKTTALLVMHWQTVNSKNLEPSQKAAVLNNLKKAIDAARTAGVPVIYAMSRFRDGYPEISPKNVRGNQTKQTGKFAAANPDTRICDEIKPNPGEVVVINTRVSAFTGSDLEIVLRSGGIDTLMLAGLSSIGVVTATAIAATDMDYRVFTLGDCCTDKDPELHKLATTVVLTRTSIVCNSDDFVAAIS